MNLEEAKALGLKYKYRNRVGRGIGSGNGKTAGRGHKGAKSRSGWSIRLGWEGGQMPLQRRLPKVGFSSRVARMTTELRLHELMIPTDDLIDIESLKKAGLVSVRAKKVKVILSGKITKAVKIRGLAVTKGARAAIEAAGGKIEN